MQENINHAKKHPGFWLALAVMLLLAAAGCAGGLSPADEDRARTALQQGLEAWKKGESAKKWSNESASIRFTDGDWLGGYKLMSYEIERISHSSSGNAEGLVKLSVKPPKGPVLEREGLFVIHLRDNQTIISRDPMH